MINVGIPAQQKFLSDSVDKQVRLEFETNTDLSEVNWYGGTNGIGYESTWTNTPIHVGTGYNYHNLLWYTQPGWTHIEDYHDRVKYICVNFEISILGMTANQLPAKCKVGFQYHAKDGSGDWRTFDTINTASLFRSAPSDLKARVSIIREWNSPHPYETIDYITFGFVADENFPQGTDVTVTEMRFGGIQYDLSNDKSELPFDKNFHTYITTDEYLDHIVDDGPLIPDITNEDIQLESLSLTESLCSQDNLKFGCCEAAHFEIGIVNHHDKFFNKIIKPYICCWKKTDPDYDAKGDVPLGVFRIKDVKQEYMYEFDKKTLTCYDKMTDLDVSVGDWLTKYMWIWDTANKASTSSPDYSRYGVEYSRQLFSTFTNLMRRLNLLSDKDFTLTQIDDMNVPTGDIAYGYDYIYYDLDPSQYMPFVMCVKKIRAFNYSPPVLPAPDCIKVVLHPRDGKTDEELYASYPSWWAIKTDEKLHGFPSSASVLLRLTYEDGHEYDFLGDNGDYFYVGPNVTHMEIWAVTDIGRLGANEYCTGVSSSYGGLVDHYTAYSAPMPKLFAEMSNPMVRLVYYNYGTHELASFDSGCTGREAIRSLLEVNGCFFHMNRYGKPEIIYATKAGLYPRNDLYPSEDLFPKGTDVPLMSMGRYISFERADYEVHNYGKIQIKTNARVSGDENKSICSYEYEGDPDYDNVYIIEDNIFYCSDGTVYEYGSQPEVDEMLRNMYNIIKNMKYVPHTTKAVGQPYIECGDRLRLMTVTGGAESFIFRRTLKGIHGLKDTYEAEGDEYNEALNTFDYVPYSPGS